MDHKENWAPKNWCFWTVVTEKTLESPLHCKEIKPVNHKGNQSWIVIGKIDTEAEAPVLWPPDAKNWLIGKDPDAGKDWRQKEKGTTEDGWIASPTQWTWIWACSRSWWRTRKPGVLQSMRSQRIWHDWTTKWNWTEITSPFNAHKFDQNLGDSGWQVRLACYSSWGHKESDTTQWLNNNKNKPIPNHALL